MLDLNRFSLILLLAAGCSGASSGNPRNPTGLGPQAVDTGAATNPGAAGSYVLLAKTGITNVTGSMITGGNLGLSPASASFITGFALVTDSSNVFSTSSSLVPPAKVYAACSPRTPTRPADRRRTISISPAATSEA